MKRSDLKVRVYTYLRDPNANLYPERNVYDYLNEAIDRCKTYIDELSGMTEMKLNGDEPEYLPREYHYILALYSASRCFEQEERFYQATQKMNEFEIKLDELRTRIRNGDILIKDKLGNVVRPIYINDEYVGISDYWNVPHVHMSKLSDSQIDDDERVIM